MKSCKYDWLAGFHFYFVYYRFYRDIFCFICRFIMVHYKKNIFFFVFKNNFSTFETSFEIIYVNKSSFD